MTLSPELLERIRLSADKWFIANMETAETTAALLESFASHLIEAGILVVAHEQSFPHGRPLKRPNAIANIETYGTQVRQTVSPPDPPCWHKNIGPDTICLDCGKKAAIKIPERITNEMDKGNVLSGSPSDSYVDARPSNDTRGTERAKPVDTSAHSHSAQSSIGEEVKSVTEGCWLIAHHKGACQNAKGYLEARVGERRTGARANCGCLRSDYGGRAYTGIHGNERKAARRHKSSEPASTDSWAHSDYLAQPSGDSMLERARLFRFKRHGPSEFTSEDVCMADFATQECAKKNKEIKLLKNAVESMGRVELHLEDDLKKAEQSVAELTTKLAATVPLLEYFVSTHSIWEHDGKTQDPYGAHALLGAIRARGEKKPKLQRPSVFYRQEQ